MKFVFYKYGKKYTVNNATIYDCNDPALALSTYLITSTRGSIGNEDLLQNQELLQEVREGIDWNNVSVN